MKKLRICIYIIFILIQLTSCSMIDSLKSSNSSIPFDTSFIYGADISSIISLEKSGVKYYDNNGNESDIFNILSTSGINYIRVRVWNNPYDSNGNGYGGGNSDVEKASIIGKRAADNNMKLLVDFHYSDFWADPSKQNSPKSWNDMPIEEKSSALKQYTKESLSSILKAGADIGMVQIGNETTSGMAGEKDWKNICILMNSGIDAVQEIEKEYNISILTAVHFTNPEKEGSYEFFAKTLQDNNVDYDVFASSYYPYWHGTIDNLTTQLTNIANNYGKKVIVAETSYAYTLDNGDGHPNTISNNSDLVYGYAASIEGQSSFLKDLVSSVKSIGDSSLGVFYWEAGWIPVGSEYDKNSTLWEKYGSGWASSYAGEYDSEDAGKWYGGCAVENQALFDFMGKPLDSLKAFTGQ